MPDVKGDVDAGWGAVADAFRRGFESGGEVGAACCVYRAGRPVVDLWGGVADHRTGRQWNRDTLAVVFSTTKGMTAICAHMLVQSGELDLDAPVVKYWPEFGANGKRDTLVRWFLSHQAGVPGIDAPLTLEQACAWEPVIRALEAQKPLWKPGTRQAYHPLTYGFLVGEIVRRVTSKSLGRFFADEIAAPLDLNAWIGLPEAEEPLVSHLIVDRTPQLDVDARLDAMLGEVPKSVAVPEGARAALKEMWSNPIDARASRLGGAFPPDMVTEDGGHNARIVHASEHPGSGMVTDARSLARCYAATIGEVDGLRLLKPSTVEEMCVRQSAPLHGVPVELEAVVGVFESRSLGFTRPTPSSPLLGPRSFGHPGHGGSLAFADPDREIAFGYVMNRIASDNEIANSLTAAVASCIGTRPNI
jgi:CubicO group peptidase (beta-lactamase class C family)